MRDLRLGKLKQQAQVHTASKRQSWDLNSSLSAPFPNTVQGGKQKMHHGGLKEIASQLQVVIKMQEMQGQVHHVA